MSTSDIVTLFVIFMVLMGVVNILVFIWMFRVWKNMKLEDARLDALERRPANVIAPKQFGGSDNIKTARVSRNADSVFRTRDNTAQRRQ